MIDSLNILYDLIEKERDKLKKQKQINVVIAKDTAFIQVETMIIKLATKEMKMSGKECNKSLKKINEILEERKNG